MADIGTDHGLLPAYLVTTGRVPSAIGIDDKELPLAGARASLEALGIHTVELRHASGCVGLAAGEVRTITIAGMGGPSIARILEGLPAGVTRLVLQPNAGATALRAWLGGHGWTIDAEQVVRDRGRFFMIVSAVPGSGPVLDDVDRRYGVVASHRDRPLLTAMLEADEARLLALLSKPARHEDVTRGSAALQRQIADAREAHRRGDADQAMEALADPASK